MGYSVVVATLLVSFGRLSDMFGRVTLYNLGFAVFTAASILLFLTPGKGNAGAMEVVIFRMVQAIGGGFLLANSAAILTDAFPPSSGGWPWAQPDRLHQRLVHRAHPGRLPGGA